MKLEHILIFDKQRGIGIDIDYNETTGKILAVEALDEDDL